MSFWVVYWLTVAVSLLLASFVGWVTVKKDGETITFGNIFITLAVIFFPFINVIAMVLGIIAIIAVSFDKPIFKGKKDD